MMLSPALAFAVDATRRPGDSVIAWATSLQLVGPAAPPRWGVHIRRAPTATVQSVPLVVWTGAGEVQWWL